MVMWGIIATFVAKVTQRDQTEPPTYGLADTDIEQTTGHGTHAPDT